MAGTGCRSAADVVRPWRERSWPPPPFPKSATARAEAEAVVASPDQRVHHPHSHLPRPSGADAYSRSRPPPLHWEVMSAGYFALPSVSYKDMRMKKFRFFEQNQNFQCDPNKQILNS